MHFTSVFLWPLLYDFFFPSCVTILPHLSIFTWTQLSHVRHTFFFFKLLTLFYILFEFDSTFMNGLKAVDAMLFWHQDMILSFFWNNKIYIYLSVQTWNRKKVSSFIGLRRGLRKKMHFVRKSCWYQNFLKIFLLFCQESFILLQFTKHRALNMACYGINN